MKINNIGGVMRAYHQQASRQISRSDEAARTGKSDGVRLSREAQEVLGLKDKLNQASEVRGERVEELRRQIEAGTYRPDAREVANRMLSSRIFDDLA